MLQILWIISFILMEIIIYKITDCFVDIKENIVFKLIALVGLTIVTNTVIFVSDIVNVLYALIGYMAIMIVCYQGSIIKRISVVMVLYPIIVSINLLKLYFSF